MKLRDYQTRCAATAWMKFEHGLRRQLVTLPTGCGKTVLFASLADEWVRQAKGRVIIICPTIELVRQGADKMEGVSKCPVAIEQASSWSNEDPMVCADFVIACKPSLLSKDKYTGNPRYMRFKGITLVIVDEAHLSITKKFADMIDWFVDGGASLLGVTATPMRTDGKAMANVYEHETFTMGISEAIDNGWLVGCKSHCIEIQSLDLSAVKTTRADFKEADLGKVLEDDAVCYEIAAVTAREMECDD